MSSAAAASRASRRDGDGGSSAAGFGRWTALLGLVVALALLAAWLLGWFGGATDPRVVEIRKMREELAAKFQANGGPATMADATAMMAGMGQIREKIDALPEHLRPQAERGGGGMFRSAMRARIDAYFALPPDKRQAELDRQINQEELMRKAMEAGRTVANALGGGAGAGGGQANANAGPPRGGPPGGGTEDDRNRWRKSMIDRTSPTDRARYVEYRRAMEERREKRGLPASPWGGR
jgi:hypothetical protein